MTFDKAYAEADRLGVSGIYYNMSDGDAELADFAEKIATDALNERIMNILKGVQYEEDSV
jgi:acylphosphatase